MCALQTGIDLANIFKCDLRMVHVRPVQKYAQGFAQTKDIVAAESLLDKILLEQRQNYFGGGKFDYKVREGSAAEELCNQAKYDDTTFIVMGSHGVSGITTSWIGGTAYKLISLSACPVIVIRPDMSHPKEFTKIAARITIKKTSRIMLPVVASLAKMTGAKVSLIGVQESKLDWIFNRITMSVRQAKSYLQSAGIADVESTAFVKGGDEIQKFMDIVRESKVDALALDVTNTGNFFADRFRPFLTAVINTSPCPVITIPVKSIQTIK